MNILHLNSNYLFTKIYANAIKNMDSELNHYIFNPLYRNINYKNNMNNVNIYAPVILKKSDRLLTRYRLNKAIKYIENKDIIKNINIVHAHSLTNDGILAYKLSEKHNIPYILTIRNTDINYSLKYKKYNMRLYKNTLKNASLIIFPNNSYKKNLLNLFENDSVLREKLINSKVIPNGIDSYWHDNIYTNVRSLKDEINLIYVGRIYKNKNLHNILKAVSMLESEYEINIKVVGKIIDHNYFNQLKSIHSFTYLGELDKDKLRDAYRESDIFIMPSFNETFGLVYVEALSQNLPIVYTKYEGIYGYFRDYEYGVPVQANNYNEIGDGIKYIVRNYSDIQYNLKNKAFLESFNWETIGKIYSEIYAEWKL